MGIFETIARLFDKGVDGRDKLVPIFPEVERPKPAVPDRVGANDNPTPYRAFTREFDRVVEAQELTSFFGEFGPVGLKRRDEAWATFQAAMQAWRIRVHLRALKADGVIRDKVPEDSRANATVTLLVDQSGSMRGQSMMLAAASTDIAQEFLRKLGITVEILGFTTVKWRGGRSREKWQGQGRPRKPGRLNDLLHIVYRSADDLSATTCEGMLQYMAWPELLRENIDGEALEWAAERLRRRPEPSKILIVISDGAPVDDSTLAANGPNFLDAHLLKVTAELEREPGFSLAAIGIGHDVGRYYRTAEVIQTPDDLGESLITLLQHVLLRTLAP